MGLFKKSEPVELDSTLVELLTGYEERKQQKAMNLLRKAQPMILSVTTDLRPSEMPRMLVVDAWLRRFLLVTNQRSVEFDGVGNKEIEHGDVAKTELGTTSGHGYTVVAIESRSALLDYRPNDHSRFEKIIVFQVQLPRTGTEICAEIEPHIRPV